MDLVVAFHCTKRFDVASNAFFRVYCPVGAPCPLSSHWCANTAGTRRLWLAIGSLGYASDKPSWGAARPPPCNVHAANELFSG